MIIRKPQITDPMPVETQNDLKSSGFFVICLKIKKTFTKKQIRASFIWSAFRVSRNKQPLSLFVRERSYHLLE